jgi:parallel beta-helix repeat protein
VSGFPGPRPENTGLLRPVEAPRFGGGRLIDATGFGATGLDRGGDDAVAIQRAIDAARPGDTVWLPDGTYDVKRRIDLRTGVGLAGQSRAGTILAGAAGRMLSAAAGTTDLVIERLSLASTGTAVEYPVWLGDGDSTCTTCTGSTLVERIVVRDLDVAGFARMGVSVRNGADVVIENCRIHDATADSGGGRGYGVMLGYPGTRNSVVRNNSIEPGDAKMRHGVLIQYSAGRNLVSGNTIRATSGDGIDLHGELEYGNEIVANTVTWSARAGIGIGNTGGTATTHAGSGPDNWLHGNELSGNAGGVTVIRGSDRQVISGNTISGSAGAGIEVRDGGGDGLRIAGNRIGGNRDGIVLADSAGSVVEDNDVSGNREHSLDVAASVSGLIVRRNDLRGAPYVDTGNGTVATGNQVR